VRLETDRLILRQWRDDDRPAFAALNADPVVMEFFPETRTRQQADTVLDRLIGHFDRHGFGFWALELRESGENIGFTGLQHVDFDAPFCPAVEIGWRLARSHWGKGYATEAARAALDAAFRELKLDEVVSYAVKTNTRSRAVMERLGMVHEPELDFEDTDVEPSSPLRPLVFYRMTKDRWKEAPPR
jgi:RimJ/RimL family protein N-acetyltransferase